MEAKKNGGNGAIKLLMFPWLAHGHISPFLELAKKLTKRNFHVYFCSTPINLNSIKPKISQKYSNSIELVELHLPSLPELPPHYHTTKGLPPYLMPTLKTAFDMSSSPNFLNILKTYKPDLLIYDFLQPWAPSIASSLNIPAVNFLSTSALTATIVLHYERNPDAEFPLLSVNIANNYKIFVHCLHGVSTNGIKDIDWEIHCLDRSSDVILVKTFEELEAKYMDYFSFQMNKKIVPVGPLVEDTIDENQENQEEEIIMEWLNKKANASSRTTIFVSFGSEYFLSKQQREEVAHGLELSNVEFIWVIRFPIGEKLKLEEALPKGYLERVKERGLIVEDWAPQRKILGHESIGGFVSHCGWSSVMESMKLGVPIIAMPMNLDQPLNARLVEDMGVGVEVKRNESGGFERDEIAKTMREVVVDKGGEDVRKKAREMSRYMKEKGEKEIDGVVNELVRLCNVN